MIKNISFRNERNLTLQGSLWQAPSQSIIIMAHGSASNRFAKGLFKEIAESIQKENYNVLSFDFSGHGASDDDILTLKKAVSDLIAAIRFCKDKGYQKIALLGHSLGALTCLQAFSLEIEIMILVGALTGPMHKRWDAILNEEQAQCLQQNGYIALEVNDGLRKELKIDGNLLHDIDTINQQDLLSRITCPVLIIHGNGDSDERSYCEISKKGFHWLTKNSQLEVINDATHDFLNSTSRVIRLIKVWLQCYFSLDKF